MILSSILTLLKINLSYLELFFMKFFIKAMESVRFETYLCRIFSSRSRSRKSRLFSFVCLFVCVFCLLLS